MNASDMKRAEAFFIERLGDAASDAIKLMRLPGVAMMMSRCHQAFDELKISSLARGRQITSGDLEEILRSLLPEAPWREEIPDPGLVLAQFLDAEWHCRRRGDLDDAGRLIVDAYTDVVEDMNHGVVTETRDDNVLVPTVLNFFFWTAEHKGVVSWYCPDAVRQ